MELKRFVLCRPQGGLNDVLCQIELVCQYAEKFNRTVIVDTNYHSTAYIKDQFSRYFVSKQERVILDSTGIESQLKGLSVVPKFLADDLHRYEAHFISELGFVEKNSSRPITFDFSKDYAESLLVHHRAGSKPGASVAALSRLRLNDNLSDELAKRLNSIGSNYDSIHIRNTDYTTNYQVALNELKRLPALQNCNHLFVATDNIACLEFCRMLFPHINIISFSQLPQEGRPLHKLSKHDDIYERNKEAILDLLMLALSRKFILLQLNQNRWGTRYSGFSLLARDLRNAKTTLSSLIARPEINIDSVFGARVPRG